MSFYQSQEFIPNGYVVGADGRLYERTTVVTRTTSVPVPVPVHVPVQVSVPVSIPFGFGYSSPNIQVAQIQQSHADVLNARAGLRGGPSYYTICGNCGNRPGGCRYCPRS